MPGELERRMNEDDLALRMDGFQIELWVYRDRADMEVLRVRVDLPSGHTMALR